MPRGETKCTKPGCGGIFRVVLSESSKDRQFLRKRTRKCDICGVRMQTYEISREAWDSFYMAYRHVCALVDAQALLLAEQSAEESEAP
jgi:hypothetical protein